MAYEESVTITLIATESSLEERRTEPPSVVGSETGSEAEEVQIEGEDDGRGCRITDKAIDREIAEMRTLWKTVCRLEIPRTYIFKELRFRAQGRAKDPIRAPPQLEDWFDQIHVHISQLNLICLI